MLDNYLENIQEAPVTSMQANIRQDIKASRSTDILNDNHDRMNKIDNQINKLIHHIKTNGNSKKLQTMLMKARKRKLELQRKISG